MAGYEEGKQGRELEKDFASEIVAEELQLFNTEKIVCNSIFLKQVWRSLGFALPSPRSPWKACARSVARFRGSRPGGRWVLGRLRRALR